jgi:hypothetical protein
MVKNKQGGSPEGCGGYAGVVKVGKLTLVRQKKYRHVHPGDVYCAGLPELDIKKN